MISNLQGVITDIRKRPKIWGVKPKVVLVTGTFDLFHYEHLRCLQGAKEQGDLLIVAVKNDRCARLKGNDRPIIDETSRAVIVDNIKCVDYTFLVDYNPEEVKLEIKADNEKQREWLVIFQEVFKKLRPDILYYEDNPTLQSARDRILEKYNITGIKKQRGEKTSTTEIISKIRKTGK